MSRSINGSSVSEDDGLSPVEKQFSITGVKDDDRLKVHSEIASITRRLLAHADVEISSRRVQDGDVVAVTAYLPRAYLSILSSPRENDGWADVVSEEVLR